MDKYRLFLRQRGADQAGHMHGSLLEHLQGTLRLLQSWGCDPHVCRAGLFHSIYGTSIYGHRSVDLSERQLVKRLIGGDSERLAFLFCVADRPQAWLEALSGKALRHRITGAMHPIDRGTLTGLLEIESANLLEQAAGWDFVQQFLGLQTAHGLRLRPPIIAALRDGLARNQMQVQQGLT